MMHRTVFMVLTLLFTAAGGLVATAIAADSQGERPVVIETFPVTGDSAVDPALKEIRVTFNKAMQTDRMWSWVMESNESFPKTTGEPRYLDDKRTCVLAVELLRGHAYKIWINSAKFDHFRDLDNKAAVPYLLEFHTKK
jgi:hypothetical protein